MFAIKNETGSSVTLGGTAYANNSFVDITKYIAFEGIKWTRNDVDGQNAGRALDGLMIRDRITTKSKWEVSLIGHISSSDAQAIIKLSYPQTFHIKTDFPTGAEETYNVYSNNIPVVFKLKKPDGTIYYGGMSIPFVEV